MITGKSSILNQIIKVDIGNQSITKKFPRGTCTCPQEESYCFLYNQRGWTLQTCQVCSVILVFNSRHYLYNESSYMFISVKEI